MLKNIPPLIAPDANFPAARVAAARGARLVRLAFYERASAACLILQTGERRRYGNLILRKGVVDT